MGSVRDPGRAAMEAEELRRARLSVQQAKTQATARRNRERRMGGAPAARRELAQDFAGVNAKERSRAAQPVPLSPPE